MASSALDDTVKIYDVSHLSNRPVETFDMEAYELSLEERSLFKCESDSEDDWEDIISNSDDSDCMQ